MKLKNVFRILLLRREISVSELADRLNVKQPAASRSIAHAEIAPAKSVADIMRVLECHAEVTIVDDLTGERYDLD